MCNEQYFIRIFLVESKLIQPHTTIMLFMFLLVLTLNFYCYSHTHLVKLDGVEYADYKMRILSTRFSDEIKEPNICSVLLSKSKSLSSSCEYKSFFYS